MIRLYTIFIIFTTIGTLLGKPLNARLNYFTEYWDVLNRILARERTGKVTHWSEASLLCHMECSVLADTGAKCQTLCNKIGREEQ